MSGTYEMKPGCGVHHLRNGRTLHPGDTIECEPEELKGAMDKFKCTVEPPPLVQIRTLKIVERSGGRGWYDVINETAKRPLNDHALRLEDAQAIVAQELGIHDGDENADGP